MIFAPKERLDDVLYGRKQNVLVKKLKRNGLIVNT